MTEKEDAKTLDEMDIGDLSIINLVVRLRGGGIQLTVKIYDGKEIKVYIDISRSVKTLKKRI